MTDGRRFHGRKALVLSPVPTHPTTHGNRARIVALIEVLQEWGFDVHVAVLQTQDWDGKAMSEAYGTRLLTIPYTRPPRRENLVQSSIRRARQLIDEDARHVFGGDDWYDDATDAAMESLDRDTGFDLAIVEYVFMSRALLRLKSPRLKVIDTHDIFANRHQLFLRSGLLPSFFSTTVQEEKRCLARADLVLGIQRRETEQLLAYGLNAITFGHTVAVQLLYESRESEFDLLLVGSVNDMNVQGMLWFGQQVMPHLAKACRSLRIAVVGGLCNVVPDFPGILKLGVVSDLRACYSRARLVINPTRDGTGLNIKSIEAMGFGIPVLSTLSGARGLEDAHGSAIAIADTADAFANKAILLLGARHELLRLSNSAIEFCRTWNAAHTNVFHQHLAAAFPEVEGSNPGEPVDLAYPSVRRNFG